LISVRHSRNANKIRVTATITI